MNMRSFVLSLTLDEMNQLKNAIHEVQHQMIMDNTATYPPIDADIVEIYRSGKRVDAIVAYRRRNPHLSLIEARTVIEVFGAR